MSSACLFTLNSIKSGLKMNLLSFLCPASSLSTFFLLADQGALLQIHLLIDYSNVCLAIAGMSAEVGGIVVVFIAFAVQELRNISGKEYEESELYKSIHHRSKLIMLLFNASFSMVAFLLGALLTIFGLLEPIFSERALAVFSVAFFSYGIFSLFLSVLAFIILEKPFWSVSLGRR